EIREDLTRNNILLSKYGNYKHLITKVNILNDHIKMLKSSGLAQAILKKSSNYTTETNEEKNLKERVIKPIIVVPYSLQTLINTTNAIKFLQYGIYEKPKLSGNPNDRYIIKKPSKLKKNVIAEFELINTPTKND